MIVVAAVVIVVVVIVAVFSITGTANINLLQINENYLIILPTRPMTDCTRSSQRLERKSRDKIEIGRGDAQANDKLV